MFENAPPSAGEVRALAHQLMSWADHLVIRPIPGREPTEEDGHDLSLGLALATREVRRLRAEIFAEAAFGNPNWDIMLDLFIQEANGYRTSLDHLALSGDLPAATVYQSVDALCAMGLIDRAADRFDNRVAWLSLTDAGRRGMADLLARSAELVRPIARRTPDRQRVGT